MNKLYGAILGDLAGQPFEFPAKGGPRTGVQIHNPDSHFTDDTIMTLATASYLLGDYPSFEMAYKTFGLRYQGDYYGKMFGTWIMTPPGVLLDSFGNGCLMRISPIMYMEQENRLPLILDSVLTSHRHEVSIRSVIKLDDEYYNEWFPYIGTVEPFKRFTSRADDTINFCIKLTGSVSGTVNTIIKAIECGGDTDTNASICGELSNYRLNDLTKEDIDYVDSKLDNYLLDILKRFNEKFGGQQ